MKSETYKLVIGMGKIGKKLESGLIAIWFYKMFYGTNKHPDSKVN